MHLSVWGWKGRTTWHARHNACLNGEKEPRQRSAPARANFGSMHPLPPMTPASGSPSNLRCAVTRASNSAGVAIPRQPFRWRALTDKDVICGELVPDSPLLPGKGLLLARSAWCCVAWRRLPKWSSATFIGFSIKTALGRRLIRRLACVTPAARKGLIPVPRGR